MSGKIYLDGQEVDGSWVLRIYITDLKIERCLRVKGDLHVGGVMLRLVEDLNIALDWSDHALWWPSRNFWLTRTRSTLDQYGVTADAILHFTPMHKALRIQLPDMRYIDCKIDFSVKTFNAVINICKELCIRYPEELSFCKPLEPHDLKQNLKDNPTKKKLDTESYKNGANALSDTNTFVMRTQNNYGSIDSLDQHEPYLCAPIGAHSKINRTLIDSSEKNPENWRRNNNTLDISNKGCFNHNSSSTGLELFNAGLLELLSQTPSSLSSDENLKILRPRTLLERARINVSWLDSSLSIMEQGICEYDTLKLRYKFYSFYDLNPKLDQVRINMIYEQAKWQLLSEEIDCTEEEMFVFAGLQMQVNFQASTWKPGRENNDLNKLSIDDDIDAALTDLQITLEGSAAENINSNITQIPELSDYLRLFKPKRFTLKAFKKYWIVCKDLHLKIYKNREDCEIPVFAINLHGCEITPDIHIAQNRYGIRLEVPSAEGMTEIWIRCDTEKQYANWLAACRLAAKGRSLADASYSNEVKRIEDFLQLQKPSTEPTISPTSLGDINPEDYVASRFLKKLKVKLIQRILEAQANVKNLTLIEAKLEYIKAWQSLPEYGISLFAVRFAGKNKDELLGIAFNRLLRMDINTGNHLKTWRFNTMKAWNINWEVKHMMVQFEEENIIFECRTADCKVVHEFIGGYIFLSMRSKEANQSLNEEMFHKLTGGWH